MKIIDAPRPVAGLREVVMSCRVSGGADRPRWPRDRPERPDPQCRGGIGFTAASLAREVEALVIGTERAANRDPALALPTHARQDDHPDHRRRIAAIRIRSRWRGGRLPTWCS
jgi:hypothetical protein